MARRGYVYCIANDAIPGIVKIGATVRDPEDRLSEARATTWAPSCFRIVAQAAVDDAFAAEHALLLAAASLVPDPARHLGLLTVLVAALQAGGTAPPEPGNIDKMQLRELVRRKLVVEREGLYFHPDAIAVAANTAAALLRDHPDGFTVSQFREALSITRKHAVPLAAELDSRGITRRRDDVRIGGPRLPDA
jgi:hypothetical protein